MRMQIGTVGKEEHLGSAFLSYWAVIFFNVSPELSTQLFIEKLSIIAKSSCQ